MEVDVKVIERFIITIHLLPKTMINGDDFGKNLRFCLNVSNVSVANAFFAVSGSKTRIIRGYFGRGICASWM